MTGSCSLHSIQGANIHQVSTIKIYSPGMVSCCYYYLSAGQAFPHISKQFFSYWRPVLLSHQCVSPFNYIQWNTNSTKLHRPRLPRYIFCPTRFGSPTFTSRDWSQVFLRALKGSESFILVLQIIMGSKHKHKHTISQSDWRFGAHPRVASISIL